MIKTMHRDTNVTHIAYKTFRRRVNDTDGRIFLKIFAAKLQLSFYLLSRAKYYICFSNF